MIDFIWPTYDQHMSIIWQILVKSLVLMTDGQNTMTWPNLWPTLYLPAFHNGMTNNIIKIYRISPYFPFISCMTKCMTSIPTLLPYISYMNIHNHFPHPTNTHTYIYTIWPSIWPTQGDYLFEYGHGAIFEILDGSDHLFAHHFLAILLEIGTNTYQTICYND